MFFIFMSPPEEINHVDREAETKEPKDITGSTVDREVATVEGETFHDVNWGRDTKGN